MALPRTLAVKLKKRKQTFIMEIIDLKPEDRLGKEYTDHSIFDLLQLYSQFYDSLFFFMKKYILAFILLLSLSSCLDNILAPLIITGAVTDIDKDGAVFHAKVTDLGNKGIIEFGFVWDTIHNPVIEKAEKYIFHNQPEIGNYEAKISSSLITQRTYYVRAFIRNAKVTTYGEETCFVSLGGKGCEITSISPLLGNLSDTLVVVGKNFSVRSSVVKINEIKARIIKSNQDSIYLLVPQVLSKKTSAVSITTLDQTITAKDSFTLISPIISSFAPKTGNYGDEVTIKGKNFQVSPLTLSVFFDKALATFQIIDDQTIKAVVPNDLANANCSVRVLMNNQITEAVDKYTLLPVEITDFNPKTALTGETITLSGKNFTPMLNNNKVYVGGVLAKPVSVSQNTLTVTLSLQDTAVYENRNATVKVDVGGNIRTFNDKLLINDRWFRLSDSPVNLYYQNSFVVDKTAYIGLNDTKSFWSYNTETNTWKKLADFPGEKRASNAGFVYQNKIYFGTGRGAMIGYDSYKYYNDWWEYDTKTNTWLQKNNYAGSLNGNIGFSTIDGCFLTAGYTYTYNRTADNFTYHINTEKYNPSEDSWSLLEIGSWIDTEHSGMDYWNPFVAATNGSEVYINLGVSNLYRYTDKMYIANTNNNTMKRIADYPNVTNQSVVALYLNGIAYIKRMDSDQYNKSAIYYYNKTNNVWKYENFAIYSSIEGGYGSFSFEVGNIGYIGNSYNNNRLYEFDPNR